MGPASGDRFVATPFLLHGAQDSAETQAFGWRLAPLDGEGDAPDLDMSLKAVRRTDVTGETEHGVGVEGRSTRETLNKSKDGLVRTGH